MRVGEGVEALVATRDSVVVGGVGSEGAVKSEEGEGREGFEGFDDGVLERRKNESQTRRRGSRKAEERKNNNLTQSFGQDRLSSGLDNVKEERLRRAEPNEGRREVEILRLDDKSNEETAQVLASKSTENVPRPRSPQPSTPSSCPNGEMPPRIPREDARS